MIEINIGAAVESGGREVGRVERVVLDRGTFEATHLVVRHGGPIVGRHALMPINWVSAAAHDRVQIARAPADLSGLPDFEVQHYVRLDELGEERAGDPRERVKPSDWVNYLMPLVANAFGDPFHTPGVVVTDEMIARSESAVRRGFAVESSDGHKLGEVHEVLLDEEDRSLSGVVIGRGLARTRPLRIPADWIAQIATDRIVLNRTRGQVADWERQ